MVRVLLVAGSLCCLAAGCGILGESRKTVDGAAGAFKPRPYDSSEDAVYGSSHHDQWEGVGKEGRAAEPKEKEWDKLTPLLMSPKAQSIESNLGYE
ncbi:MAG: hypothetical protein ACKV0T_15695 [Planctomycetales bacterium]